MSRATLPFILDLLVPRLGAPKRRWRRRHGRPFLANELTPQLLADIGLSPNGELVATEALRPVVDRCET